jgi:hypothetical protein
MPKGWVLAFCVSSNKAGFDYYHLPAKLSNFTDNDTHSEPDNDSDSRLFDRALEFGIQHWPDDLEVIYEKPKLATVRLSLAFWVELALSRAWADHMSVAKYCSPATGGRGGLKLSVV